MISIYRPIWILIFFLSTIIVQGQELQKVIPITLDLRSIEHYQEQYKLWQKEVNKSPGEAMSWLNYFTAARNINLLSPDNKINLKNIVDGAQEAVPNTFEAHFMTFWQSDFKNKRYDALRKAYEIAPEREEAYHDLMIYYLRIGDQAAFTELCDKSLKMKNFSTGIFNWNYNALMSVADNAIFFVYGDNDTYPALILQESKKVKPNVAILNLHLLAADEQYRARVFKALDIPTEFNMPVSEGIESQFKTIISHCIEHSDRPIYLNVSVANNIRQAFNDHLYLTGLAFLYSEKPVDNIAMLKNNYENRFRKDDLFNAVMYDPSQSVADYTNWNYMPALIKLYGHYKESGNKDQAENIKTLAYKIAKRANRESQLSDLLPPPFPSLKNTTGLDVKSLDKNLMSLGNDRYASATEVSNAEYEAFLIALLKEKEFSLLQSCKQEPVDWISFLPAEYKQQPEEVLFSNGHPDSPDAPAVNMTYEAAQAYCQWLTALYNQSDYKRKKFSQVKFYLPSIEEWRKAASGKATASYPWGREFTKNQKGCYVANLNPYYSEYDADQGTYTVAIRPDSPGEDGGFFPVIVTAYFPNEMGFYNMGGNVAEMVSGGQYAMGGSWLSPMEYAKIDMKQSFSLPSPEVGFRVFMQVVKP